MKRKYRSVKNVCYSCGTSKTYVDRHGYEIWYLNKGTDLVLCKKCYDVLYHLINKEYKNKQNRLRTTKCIQFKNREINVGFNPRIGVCNWCRAVVPFDTRYTQLHHDENKYDKTNPLKNTIELCVRCHGKESKRLEGRQPITSDLKTYQRLYMRKRRLSVREIKPF